MSKITFRADDDLVERLEALDASKSEAMREALRQYLDAAGNRDDGGSDDGSIDAVVAERVDELLDERLSRRAPREPESARDINVNVTVEGSGETSAHERTADRSGATDEERAVRPEEDRQTTADTSQESESCTQCGESLDAGHVYCPNCGEKAVHRIFCDCGDELRSDWAFCPGCGRRTPSADVLDTP
ncbi:CopG family transcriptional regulator [halophilic archaeon]|nr:CopG family transcriptional regulator [halophilic archaeon]